MSKVSNATLLSDSKNLSHPHCVCSFHLYDIDKIQFGFHSLIHQLGQTVLQLWQFLLCW